MKVGNCAYLLLLWHVTGAVFANELSLTCESSTNKDRRVQGIEIHKINHSIASPNPMSAHLLVDPCSFRMVRKLLLSWNITFSEDYILASGGAVMLCVTIHQLRPMTTSSSCFSLSMAGIQTFNKLQCLVDVSHMASNYIVNAYVHMNTQGEDRHWYGELRTAGLDYRKTCKYLCEYDQPIFRVIYTCLHARNMSIGNASQVTSVVLRDRNTSFSLDVSFNIQTVGYLTFSIPNVTSGGYYLEVLTHHSLGGIFCNFTKYVYISCGDPAVDTSTDNDTTKDVPVGLYFIVSAIVPLTTLGIVITIVLAIMSRCHVTVPRKRRAHARHETTPMTSLLTNDEIRLNTRQ